MNTWVRISAVLLIFSSPWQSHSAPAEVRPPQELEPLACQQVAQEVAFKLQANAAVPDPPACIAIIIDDLGYNRRLGQIAVEMPAALTLAILPHSPHGQTLAQGAINAGKEVVVHLPMSSIAGTLLDKGGLTDTMDRDLFLSTLRSNLQAIPQARGANNHMGSLLTQQREAMQWLMEELMAHELYFVDSRTTALSVASQVARELELPVLEREVFLDNSRDCRAIGQQFLRLARIAQTEGRSLAIGHPYPETLAFLKDLLPHLEGGGLRLLPVSQLLDKRDLAIDRSVTGVTCGKQWPE